jgi:hypothetical protein
LVDIWYEISPDGDKKVALMMFVYQVFFLFVPPANAQEYHTSKTEDYRLKSARLENK